MSEKIIYETKKERRVIQPAVTEVVEVQKERKVWNCDFCGRGSGDDLPRCFGCGKDICYQCIRDKESFKEYTFEVGTAEESWDNGYEPASDDYRVEFLRLCKSCQENTPEKIWKLMELNEELEESELISYKIKNKIIDEAERIRSEERIRNGKLPSQT